MCRIGWRWARRSVCVVLVVVVVIGTLAPVLAQSTPTRVGDMQLCRTTIREVAKKHGAGKRSTGTHPGSGMEWSLPDRGALLVDGEHVDRHGDYVVYRVLLRASPTSAPRYRVRKSVPLAYKGITLGSSQASALRAFGSKYTTEDAYQRPCRVWRTAVPGSRETVEVIAAFKKDRVALLHIARSE